MTKFNFQILTISSAVLLAVATPNSAQAGLLDFFRGMTNTATTDASRTQIEYQYANGGKLIVEVGLSDTALDRVTFVDVNGARNELPGRGPLTYLELPKGVKLTLDRRLRIGAKIHEYREPVFAIGWGNQVISIHQNGSRVFYPVNMSSAEARMANFHFVRKVDKHPFEVRAFSVPNGFSGTFVSEFDPDPNLIDEALRSVQISGLYAPDAAKNNSHERENYKPEYADMDKSGILLDKKRFTDDIVSLKGVAREVDILKDPGKRLDYFKIELLYTTMGTGLPAKPTGVEKTVVAANQQVKLETPLEKISEYTTDFRATSLPEVQLTQEQRDEVKTLAMRMAGGGQPLAYVGPKGANMSSMVRYAVEELPRTWVIRQMTKANAEGGQGIVGDMAAIPKNIGRAANDVCLMVVLPNLTEWATFGGEGLNTQGFFTRFAPEELARLRTVGIANEDWASAFGATSAMFQLTKWTVPRKGEYISIIRNEMRLKKAEYPLSITDDQLKRIIDTSNRVDAKQEAPGSYLEVLRRLATITQKSRNPTDEDITRAISQAYPNAPLALFDPRQIKATHDKYVAVVSDKLPGMEGVTNDMWTLIEQWLAGESDGKGGNGNIMLLSPPGLGKTRVAMVIASILGIPFERVNLGQYTSPADAQKALADLGDKVARNHGNALILMDEVEKANEMVQNAFLPAFDGTYFEYPDKAIMQQATQLRATLRGSLVIWAGNAATERIRQRMINGVSNADKRPGLIDQGLFKDTIGEGKISEPLVSRMRMLGAIYPSTANEFRRVLTSSIRQALEHSKERYDQVFTLTNETEYVESIVRSKWYPGISNREGNSIISEHVKDKIVKERLKNPDTMFDAGHGSITLPLLPNPCHSYMESIRMGGH